MFDFDKWQEIGSTLRRNKLRSFMTAAGVFWGIMMLVVMLGFGNGLENGVNKRFSGSATNAFFMWSMRTTMPYKGMRPGRELRFDDGDIEAIRTQVPEIEYLAPKNQLGGWRGGENVTRGNKTTASKVAADYPEFQYIQPVKFVKGRFINDLDIRDNRKVAVIGNVVYRQLFLPDEDPIGKEIKVQGVYFTVVGLFRSRQSGEDAIEQENTVHVPFTTYQNAFNNREVGWFAIAAKPEFPAPVVEEKVKALLRERHGVHPEDNRAIGSWSTAKMFGRIQTILLSIKLLVWLVGIVTLLAGIIGVSNIMLIVVKERTKEIGIRKALGATPASIVSQLVQESTVLTAVAGYVGLLTGLALLELSAKLIPPDSPFLGTPTIDLSIAIIATVVLIVAGAFAGFMPARAAVRINPVEALRAE